MTVCLAAICRDFADKAMIVTASDRMITAGDIEVEWTHPKSQPFDSWALSLNAGSAVHHVEIIRRVTARLSAVGSINDMAELAGWFGQAFAELRLELAERIHLLPLGLDRTTFVTQQSLLAPQEVTRLANALLLQQLGNELIVCGVDSTGAHVYVVSDPGIHYCMDDLGFAAIGSGGRHAQAAFMMGGYDPATSIGIASFQAYVAKRRSEVAPGVGTTTDMRFVWSNKAISQLEPEAVSTIFGGHYDKIVQGEQSIRDDAEDQIHKMFKEAFERQKKALALKQVDQPADESAPPPTTQAEHPPG